MSTVVDFQFYLNQADTRLFKSITRSNVHCLQTLLPALKPTAGRELRKRNHSTLCQRFAMNCSRSNFYCALPVFVLMIDFKMLHVHVVTCMLLLCVIVFDVTVLRLPRQK